LQRLSLPSAVRRLVSMAHLQTLLKLGFGSISYLQGFLTDFTRNTYTSRACNFFIGGRGVENTQSPKNKSPFLILDPCNTKIWENVKKSVPRRSKDYEPLVRIYGYHLNTFLSRCKNHNKVFCIWSFWSHVCQHFFFQTGKLGQKFVILYTYLYAHFSVRKFVNILVELIVFGFIDTFLPIYKKRYYV